MNTACRNFQIIGLRLSLSSPKCYYVQSSYSCTKQSSIASFQSVRQPNLEILRWCLTIPSKHTHRSRPDSTMPPVSLFARWTAVWLTKSADISRILGVQRLETRHFYTALSLILIQADYNESIRTLWRKSVTRILRLRFDAKARCRGRC